MYKACFVTVFFTFYLLTVANGQSSFLPESVKAFIDSQEALVKEVAEAATELHARRVQFVRQCECSKHGCSNDFRDTPCSTLLGTPDFCSTEGRRLDNTSTIFLTPPEIDPFNLNGNLKETICVYKHLEESVFPLNNSDYGWTYVGTRDGHLRLFPAAPQVRQSQTNDPFLGECAQFDPRVRPWYVAASTGPKDVVLIVDKSGSMNDNIDGGSETKWNIARKAVLQILQTFTYTDFVNVVTFAGTAAPLWTDRGLTRGRRENLLALEYEFNEQTPQGATHFRPAFEVAFQLLTNGCDQESACSNCQKIILFLTDGEDTSQENDESIESSMILSIVESLQERLKEKTSRRAAIFTYSMSKAADDAIPRMLACANDGAWSFIGKDTNALDALNSYYLYVASGRGNLPIWIEPYEDSLGLGQLTTVAVPFYAVGTADVPEVFLGVVGHDVGFHELQQDGATTVQILNEIIDRSQRCQPSRSTPCELQVFRNAHDRRALCTDSFSIRQGTRRRNRTVECYPFETRFYKRFSDQVSRDLASVSCEQDGGSLISVRDEAELAFIARLASVDGSWVSAKHRLGDIYSWADASVEDLVPGSTYWGLNEPFRRVDDNKCVAIDSRGIVGNLYTRSCESSLSYICVYESEAQCTDGIAELPEDGFIKFPPLDTCKSAEILDETRPVEIVEGIGSETVVCPMSTPDSSNSILCCGEDDDSNTSVFGIVVAIIIVSVVILSLGLFVRACHKRKTFRPSPFTKAVPATSV